MKDDKKCDTGFLKAFFVVVGAIVTIGAACALIYSFFKKYFKVTFDFENDDFDCCSKCDPIVCSGAVEEETAKEEEEETEE